MRQRKGPEPRREQGKTKHDDGLPAVVAPTARFDLAELMPVAERKRSWGHFKREE